MSFVQKLAALGAMLLVWAALAERGGCQQPADTNDDEARKGRMEFMKGLRSEFQLSRDGQAEQPLNAVEDPVLRWSNPIRNFFSDGGLFLWLDGKRPAAIATVSIRGNGSVWFESASLSPGALVCLRKSREHWAPQSASLAEQRLIDAPAPATSAASRLTQMRRLSEQFAFRTEPSGEQPVPLRLMPQPVYRYEDAAANILDGALFAFTETTDPEAVLLLEAVRAGGSEPAYWRITVARMTSRPVVAKRNDTTLWSVPGYWLNPRSTSDAYQERQLTVYPPPIK